MPEENTLLTDEELENIRNAATLAGLACSGAYPAAAPTCWAVAGGFIGTIYSADWIWDNLVPDALKSFIADSVGAYGVFDWQRLYDPIYDVCVESHANAVRSVDAAWAELHKTPAGPSPAGAFLNDYLNRNGWRDYGVAHFKVDGKTRRLVLEPENGPWAIRWGPMPKRADEGGKAAFSKTIVNLLTSHRLRLLQRATQEALAFAGLSLTRTTWKVNAGSIREAVWVHGNSVKPERRGDLSEARVFGSGARFHASPGKRLWFHAQIAAPVLMDGSRPVCTKVFLMFQTVGAALEALHVYDGKNRIAQFDGLDFKGDRQYEFDAANARLLFPFPTIQSGLGLSAMIHFGSGMLPPAEGHDPYVHFASAGADFNRSA